MPNRAFPPSTVAPRDVSPRRARLRQPNERDASADAAARSDELAPMQRAQMARARRDAEGPAQDTDCRSIPSESGACAQPRDPALLDDVLRPGGRDAENRRTARHDPGAPAIRPDGRPAGRTDRR